MAFFWRLLWRGLFAPSLRPAVGRGIEALRYLRRWRGNQALFLFAEVGTEMQAGFAAHSGTAVFVKHHQEAVFSVEGALNSDAFACFGVDALKNGQRCWSQVFLVWQVAVERFFTDFCGALFNMVGVNPAGGDADGQASHGTRCKGMVSKEIDERGDVHALILARGEACGHGTCAQKETRSAWARH